MTVKELIESLNECDQSADVVVWNGDYHAFIGLVDKFDDVGIVELKPEQS